MHTIHTHNIYIHVYNTCIRIIHTIIHTYIHKYNCTIQYMQQYNTYNNTIHTHIHTYNNYIHLSIHSSINQLINNQSIHLSINHTYIHTYRITPGFNALLTKNSLTQVWETNMQTHLSYPYKDRIVELYWKGLWIILQIWLMNLFHFLIAKPSQSKVIYVDIYILLWGFFRDRNWRRNFEIGVKCLWRILKLGYFYCNHIKI